MRRLQSGCSLTIGPFTELNFETATTVSITQVHKHILTVFSIHIKDLFLLAIEVNLYIFDDDAWIGQLISYFQFTQNQNKL